MEYRVNEPHDAAVRGEYRVNESREEAALRRTPPAPPERSSALDRLQNASLTIEKMDAKAKALAEERHNQVQQLHEAALELEARIGEAREAASPQDRL